MGSDRLATAKKQPFNRWGDKKRRAARATYRWSGRLLCRVRAITVTLWARHGSPAEIGAVRGAHQSDQRGAGPTERAGGRHRADRATLCLVLQQATQEQGDLTVGRTVRDDGHTHVQLVERGCGRECGCTARSLSLSGVVRDRSVGTVTVTPWTQEQDQTQTLNTGALRPHTAITDRPSERAAVFF